MAQRNTQSFNRNFAGSVGSVFNPSKKNYFILEHRVSSKYHRVGEKQEVIVDYIELGRAPLCQVRFDDSFSTVSRRHAAIVKDGDGWKLIQISTTNTTFLNGHPVNTEWYLQSGDEIQLSVNGPRLCFIIPSGEKASMKTIGLTRRLSLFGQQALRPYKTAISVLAGLLILLAVGGGIWLFKLNQENNRLEEAAQKQTAQIEAANKSNEKLAQELSSNSETIDDMNGQISELKNNGSQELNDGSGVKVSSGGIDNDAINKCEPSVFFIRSLGFDITLPDGTQQRIGCGENSAPGWSGTGFLLNDGRFVTARHVVEPWYFFINGGEADENMMILNAIANNGGKVVAYFRAYSSSGAQINFSSSQCRFNRRGDQSVRMKDGTKLIVATLDNTDYSYFNYGHNSEGIPANASQSISLERGEELIILGFPLTLGYNSENDVHPIYSTAIAASYGLQNGRILTTDTNYEQGNSGGPVFKTNYKGELEVIGLVSGGAGRNTGFVVPIDAVK